MARFITLLMTVSGLVLAIGCAGAALRMADRGPVYSVAELRAHLASDPRGWLGRTVWVRGIAVAAGCAAWTFPQSTSCQDWHGLRDLSTASFLPVTDGAPAPLLASLRRLPLAGQLVPPPQYVRWWRVGVYRIQLLAQPAGSYQPPCYIALLLDAAP